MPTNLAFLAEKRKETTMETKTMLDPNQTLYEALRGVAQRYPEREALVLGDTRLTYQALLERIDNLATGLSRIGIGKGDKVGMILPTCVEALLSFFALAKIGAPFSAMSPQFRAREVQHILGDSEAVAVITMAELFGYDYLAMIESIRPNLPNLRHVIVKDGRVEEGTASLETLLAPGEGRASSEEVNPNDLVAVFYTSGTTGAPKGALHTHWNLLAFMDIVVQQFEPQDWEVLLNPFPLFHLAGIIIPLIPLAGGGKLVLLERFDPREVLRLVESERVTAIVGAPTMFGLMLRMPDFDQRDLSSLRLFLGGAAPFSTELIRALRESTGATVANGYGLTEGGLISLTGTEDPEELTATTVGRPRAPIEVKIVDDERREVPPGQAGEIATRAPFLMKGYYKRPELTAEALDAEGWLYTGDVGSLDEEGYLRIFDRKKDMIIRGAVNIYPAEIENYLVTHPKIQMAAVIGVPGAIGGERVRAYVLPMEGQELTATEVLDYCRGQIAVYKIPDEVRFVESFPLSALRKVQKFKLREEVARELAELEQRSN
jgi:fatty-acyl-CoA synthase